MRVETDRSRNGYRAYSDRKYDERFKRKTYRHDDRHYHSSRVPQKSRHHHHHHTDYPSSCSTDHSLTSRVDRQTNNRANYSSSLNDQAILNGGLPPTDLYYNSSPLIRERDLPTHSERNRYSSTHQYTPPRNKSEQIKPTFHRESSPLPSSAYRNEYRSPTPLSIDPYNESYRTSDYYTRPERYDIPQSRNCSITTLPSPVYHSDSYQTAASYMPTRNEYIQSLPSMREVDYRTREYGLLTPMDHHHQTTSKPSSNHYHSSSSYHDRSNFKRSRSNIYENSSKRPMRR